MNELFVNGDTDHLLVVHRIDSVGAPPKKMMQAHHVAVAVELPVDFGPPDMKPHTLTVYFGEAAVAQIAKYFRDPDWAPPEWEWETRT